MTQIEIKELDGYKLLRGRKVWCGIKDGIRPNMLVQFRFKPGREPAGFADNLGKAVMVEFSDLEMIRPEHIREEPRKGFLNALNRALRRVRR